MNLGLWIPLIFLWILIFTQNRNRKIILNKIINKITAPDKENTEVIEAAKRLMGKDTYIVLINDKVESGILKEIVGKAIVLEDIKTKETKSVNSDFVETIQEYPRNKKGKRKACF